MLDSSAKLIESDFMPIASWNGFGVIPNILGGGTEGGSSQCRLNTWIPVRQTNGLILALKDYRWYTARRKEYA